MCNEEMILEPEFKNGIVLEYSDASPSIFLVILLFKVK